MGIKKGKTDYLLSLIREGKSMTLGQQLRLTAYLSVPAIMAQVSSIAMQYIDASMVGSLGANAAASIGLVSTTTWLFWGLCAAAATGFSVQVAHRIGAGDFAGAKKNTLPIGYGYTCFQFFVGGCQHFYQWCASRLAGW